MSSSSCSGNLLDTIPGLSTASLEMWTRTLTPEEEVISSKGQSCLCWRGSPAPSWSARAPLALEGCAWEQALATVEAKHSLGPGQRLKGVKQPWLYCLLFLSRICVLRGESPFLPEQPSHLAPAARTTAPTGSKPSASSPCAPTWQGPSSCPSKKPPPHSAWKPRAQERSSRSPAEPLAAHGAQRAHLGQLLLNKT